MEAAAEDVFESLINLSSSKKLESKKLNKSFLLSCLIEEDNIFKIMATGEEDDNDVYLIRFTMPDWAKRKEKDFTKRINNFKLLIDAMRDAVQKNRITLYSDGFCLTLTLFYTIIFTDKELAFELHKQMEDPDEEKRLIGQFFSESEPIDEKKSWDFRADLLEYSKKFEDYGDRSYIKVRVKNSGTITWDRKNTSFRCVPEFSSLLCNEHHLEEDVIPGDEYEFDLEFMKGDPDNLKPPYFTFLHLNVFPTNYEPMLILDFNESFKDEINKSNLILDKNNKNKMNKKIKEPKIKIKKKEDSNEEDNKINIINEEKNKIEIYSDKEDENDNKINMVEGNKNNIIFNNVKVNISFNVENSNKIICVDVNDNQVKFNVDKNQVNFVDQKKNKIHIEEKKNKKPVKQLKEVKKENNAINNNNDENNKKERPSLVDRIKLFEKK